MKTRSLTNLSLVLTLSVLPFVGGCTQSNATNAEPALTNVPPAAITPAGVNSADRHSARRPWPAERRQTCELTGGSKA